MYKADLLVGRKTAKRFKDPPFHTINYSLNFTNQGHGFTEPVFTLSLTDAVYFNYFVSTYNKKKLSYSLQKSNGSKSPIKQDTSHNILHASTVPAPISQSR